MVGTTDAGDEAPVIFDDDRGVVMVPGVVATGVTCATCVCVAPIDNGDFEAIVDTGIPPVCAVDVFVASAGVVDAATEVATASDGSGDEVEVGDCERAVVAAAATSAAADVVGVAVKGGGLVAIAGVGGGTAGIG